MSNLINKFTRRMFRKVSDIVWDITSGNVGVNTAGGIVTLTQTAATETTPVVYGTSVNPFDTFGIAIPAFATQVPVEKVAPGDLIVGDSNILGWVTKVFEGGSLGLLDHNGNNKRYTPPKVAIMETNGVLVVQNLMSLTGGKDGLAGFGNNLLPLLLLKDKGAASDSVLDDILPLMLMGGLGGAGATGAAPAGGINPMMLMLLGDKGGKGLGDIDPLMLMAMSGGMGGAAPAGGINPMMLMMLGNKGGKGLGDIDPMMLMAMSGGLGGGAGGMNPLMLAMMLGDKGGKEATPLPAPGIPPLHRSR